MPHFMVTVIWSQVMNDRSLKIGGCRRDLSQLSGFAVYGKG